MFEEGSLAARLVVVVLTTVGVAATLWYEGRLWNNGLRFWHRAVLGLLGGIFIAFVALD